MTRKNSSRVILNTSDEVAEELLERHGNVTLANNIMYLDKIPFMLKASQ